MKINNIKMLRINKLFLVAALAPLAAHAAPRPNIIYIMTDQQSAMAMSCMGNYDLHTPNIDRLAASGLTFVNAYCSSPLSGPSRASMFTGNMSHEIGMPKNGDPMPEDIKSNSLGILMNKAGYECIYAGKWHVHTPSIPDREFGFHAIHEHNDYGLAESCVSFLNKRHTKPFFLVASFDNPHNVCEFARQQNLPFANLDDIDTSDNPGLPANFYRNPYDADIIKFEKMANISAYPTTEYSLEDWRKYRNAYFRLVEIVDAEIGKIVNALDKNNLWENTVVIFTSDHGDGMGAHQWNQKSALYEEVINIPLIVTLPGFKHAGKVMPQLINNGVDFYASICDWAGIELPEDKSGISFKSLALEGDSTAEHQKYIVTETLFDKGKGTRGWALRTGRYKYVLYDKGRNREQLFDMETDRGEMRNLAVEKKFHDVLVEHRGLLKEWMDKHHTPQVRAQLHLIPGVRLGNE